MKTITHPTKPEQDTALAETNQRPLLRAEEVDLKFNVHKRTVCLWAQNGTIPSHRIGGIVRFDMDEVMGSVKKGGAL